jgi:hypothetical protein
MAAGAAGGRTALVLAVLLAQIACVVGWFGSLPVRASVAAPVVALLAALGADLAVLLSTDHTTLGPVVGVLGCTVLAAMAVQLFRRGERTDLTASLAATVAAATFAVAGVAYLPALGLTSGRDLVLVGLAAVAASALPFALPGPVWLHGALGLAAGVGAAAIIGATEATLGSGTALAMGIVVACLAVVTRAGVRLGATGNRWAATVLEASIPVVIVAPVVYVVGSVLVT